MDQPTSASIRDHFAALADPRSDHTKRHQLLDILTIALCGVICGAEGWVEIEQFGNAKLPWLRTFLELPNGIPPPTPSGVSSPPWTRRSSSSAFWAGCRRWWRVAAAN